MNSQIAQPRPKAGFLASLDMRKLRQWHQYIGLFFSPAIMFFAFSGALQTFSLHEGGHGSSYEPPAWIVTIASVHKDQRLPRARLAEPEAARAAASRDEPARRPRPAPSGPSPIPLKIFVLCMAIGLISSALLGITIALRNRTVRRNALITLGLGTVLPVLLLLL